MTEFKRTTNAIDEIEQLVQRVLDSGAAPDVLRLSQLVADTGPVVEKLHRKALETDPTKQVYGPQMCEKVHALAARWASVNPLARDVLAQRGATPAAPPPAAAPAPVPVASQPLVFTTVHSTPVHSVPQEIRAAPSIQNVPDRRERASLAAQAAEARLQGGSTTLGRSPAAATPTATASASSQAPAPMDVDVQPRNVAQVKNSAIAAQPAQPVTLVGKMNSLMYIVHSVFLGHGFKNEGGGSALGGPEGAGSFFQIQYLREGSPSITATFVPVQSHLIIYGSLEGTEGTSNSRVTVQLGMTVESVQAKVDYLLVYPLVFRQCVPALIAIPPETCFVLLTGLALPTLAAMGCASRGFRVAVFEDDVLWWRVLLALPPSDKLNATVEGAMALQQRGEALPAGTCRRLVREEVQFQRAEAERRRRLREEEERQRREMRIPFMQPPRRPQPSPFGPGGFIVGGDHDLMPGGGFMPGPFGNRGGGRDPFGGGGGSPFM